MPVSFMVGTPGRSVERASPATASSELPLPHVLQHSRNGGDPKRDAPGDDVGHGLADDPIRHVHAADARKPAEQLAVEMARRADPGRGEGQLARFLPGYRHQLLRRLGG
jgi:hypothetical protein